MTMLPIAEKLISFDRAAKRQALGWIIRKRREAERRYHSLEPSFAKYDALREYEAFLLVEAKFKEALSCR